MEYTNLKECLIVDTLINIGVVISDFILTAFSGDEWKKVRDMGKKKLKNN